MITRANLLRFVSGITRMSGGRGALLVLEGCDRAGKSTQVKLLVDALKKRNIPVEARSFPDRTTNIGMLINSFLLKKRELPSETAHLLFSANRWECSEEILKALNGGTTLVVDRYAASGAAYTAAATGRDLEWCKEPDRGLPSPDMVILLKISEKSQGLRASWGKERFENTETQQKVASNFEKLKEKTWNVVNADDEQSVIHSRILEKALAIIEKVKDQPVNRLYEPQHQ